MNVDISVTAEAVKWQLILKKSRKDLLVHRKRANRLSGSSAKLLKKQNGTAKKVCTNFLKTFFWPLSVCWISTTFQTLLAACYLDTLDFFHNDNVTL